MVEFGKSCRVGNGRYYPRREGSAYQGNYPSYPHLYHGGISITVKFCEELNSLCAKFWWGQVGNEMKRKFIRRVGIV